MSVTQKLRVYIASPYSIGDACENVRRSMDCFDQLMTLGYAPYAPLLSHFQNIVHHRPYQDWIAHDLQWVLACDVVLRLPGESKGADGEVAFAIQSGIPVVYSIHDLDKLAARRSVKDDAQRASVLEELAGIQRIATDIADGGNRFAHVGAQEMVQRLGLLGRRLAKGA